MFWDLFITYVYKKDLLSKEVNVKEEITKTYDSMIKLLEQGYAFQIFQREKDELLKHFWFLKSKGNWYIVVHRGNDTIGLFYTQNAL